MNFVFISPQFPKTYWNFCNRLKNNGVTVLGVGDTPYDALDWDCKNNLDEYYYVTSLEDYDQVFRAVAYFSFRYGKIDWLESNNEYWLELDAQLRTDFNITTGARNDFIHSIKFKSAMKAGYEKAGVPTARYHMVSTLEAAEEFIREVGYPVIVKPDNGCGAEDTYKLKNENDLKAFYRALPTVPYIMEEFINGTIVSFDAVVDSHSVPIFWTSNVFPVPIMDIVNSNGHLSYWTVKDVPEDLRDAGFRTVKAFGVKSRFVHLEFFRLNEDKPGMGKKGDVVALEVNMRPAGGYTPDMINFANSVDVYRIWADMICFDERRDLDEHHQKYYCVYASQRDGRNYVHTHEEILARYGSRIVMCDRMPDALADAMGNQMYTAKLDTYEDLREYVHFIHDENKPFEENTAVEPLPEEVPDFLNSDAEEAPAAADATEEKAVTATEETVVTAQEEKAEEPKAKPKKASTRKASAKKAEKEEGTAIK